MPHAECTECGVVGERLLPDRFPHICHACLFPPVKPGEDPTADAPEFLPVGGLIEKLRTLPAPRSWVSDAGGWDNAGRRSNDP
jgi:hypothetical protein